MLDFVRDIYASFRQTSLERVKSPFLGAFVFSWFGFNWQMLSILFFSEQKIEQRLELINKSNDIGNYLLGPLCATALIVLLLPQVNKIITKIQDKPNSDTVELSLASKIRIAELQQSLAESEARKKLAEKKEERHIEEGIENIKSKLKKATKDLEKSDEDIKTLLEGVTEFQGKVAKTEGLFNAEQESKNLIQKELAIEKENNRSLSEKVMELNASLNKYNADLYKANDKNDKILIHNQQLQEKINNSEHMLIFLAETYPEIFQFDKNQESPYLAVKAEAIKLIQQINDSMTNKSNH
ncbi:MAG: hypothetical protein E7A34_00200 [Leclercia adecarboxylata]|nr:hypothetical protein [Leclercia adecarboxylata]MDU1082795.1 hypothetical protein [Leclercia adecarboxylata]